MAESQEPKIELDIDSENESEASECSSDTETTQVSSKKTKYRKATMQTRILSRLTKLMEQMMTLTKGTNRRKRRHAGSNSSTEELTDTSSLDSEVILNTEKTKPAEPPNENLNACTTLQSMTETEQTTTPCSVQPTSIQQQATTTEPRAEHSLSARPHIMPDKYDGSSDWADYDSHFDSCRTINNWTDAEAVKYLSASLRGPALRLLNERRQTKWTYHDLKSKLSTRFSSSKQAESYLLELRARKRRPNESFQELGRSIRELTTKAYPDFDSDGIDRLAKIHFTDAIENPEIRTGIFHAKAKTLDKMIEAAITTETFLLTESQRSWKKNTHNRAVDVEQTSQIQRTIDQAVDKAVRQAMSQQNSDRNNTGIQNKQPRNVVCFYCNKPGHIERNCFKKQSDLGQQTHNYHQRPDHFATSNHTSQSNELGPPTRATARPNQQ